MKPGALLAALALASGCANPAAAAGFTWPHGARAAVSLAYDDALDSQLDHALPALNRHRLRATFYLQLSAPSVRKRLAHWRAAAARGHELGNHSLFHQCSGALPDRAWVSAHRNLDTTSAAHMHDQVVLGNAMLHAIDGKSERTYTTPCGDAMAAGTDYVELLKSEFVAIKAGAGGAVTASMDALDPHAVQVYAPAGASGKELIELVRQAGAKGTMVNLTFHGVGGDYLSVSKQAHEQLLRYLAAHRAEYWTDSFVAIMSHVRRERLARSGPR